MKNTVKWFGIIVLVAVIWFSLIGCDDFFGDKVVDDEGNTTTTACIESGHDWNWVITSTGVETASGTCKRSGCNVLASGDMRFTFKLGDPGPGGGRIFYIADGKNGRSFGFRLYMNAVDSIGTTAFYLEAASYDFPDLRWASSEFTNTNVSGTEEPIGTGKKNTALILAVDSMAPAAKACDDLPPIQWT